MTAPRAPQQLRAQRTRRELLLAARRVFAERGYERATVDQIAEAARCSKGAYYFHFSSKEEALLAVLEAWIADRSSRLAWATGRPPEALIPAIAKALSWRVSGWEPKLAVEFWAQGQRNERVGERLAGAYRWWETALAVTLADGQNVPFAAEAAATVLALFDGLALQSALDLEASQLAEAHATTALESIAGAARRTRVA